MAWLYNIYRRTGVKVPFPIIADRSGEVARKYGMISSNVSKIMPIRSVFVIDDKGIVRVIMMYPMNVKRNVKELLRVVKECK